MHDISRDDITQVKRRIAKLKTNVTIMIYRKDCTIAKYTVRSSVKGMVPLPHSARIAIHVMSSTHIRIPIWVS